MVKVGIEAARCMDGWCSNAKGESSTTKVRDIFFWLEISDTTRQNLRRGFFLFSHVWSERERGKGEVFEGQLHGNLEV